LNNQYVLKQQPKLSSNDKSIIHFEGKATDYNTLIQSVQSRGVSVKFTEEIHAENSSFSVPTKVVPIGGADVQVYEFKNESDAKKSSNTISKDGTEIGTSIIRWMDESHFYTNGKILVQYIGHNPEVMDLLESFLGTQIAGM
jgi:hypothetical protein